MAKAGKAKDHIDKTGARMEKARYSMSFTTGSLFHQESVNVATLFLELDSWQAVRDKVLSANLLQARTLNTARRVYREIASRLKKLHKAELDLLVYGNPQEQRYILWLAICRRYTFIADFAKEILRERYISLKIDMNYEDFDAFFNKKAEWHDELDRVASATRVKVRQILFKMLREADLLTASNMIVPAMLGPRFLNAIPSQHHQDMLVFPMFEADLRRWA